MGKEKISGITEKHTEDKSETDSIVPAPDKQENVENATSKKRVRFALDSTTVTNPIVQKVLEDSLYRSDTTDPIPQKRLKSCLRESIATPAPIKKPGLVNTKTAEYRATYYHKNMNLMNIPKLRTIHNGSVVPQPLGFFDNPNPKTEQENVMIKASPSCESNSP